MDDEERKKLEDQRVADAVAGLREQGRHTFADTVENLHVEERRARENVKDFWIEMQEDGTADAFIEHHDGRRTRLHNVRILDYRVETANSEVMQVEKVDLEHEPVDLQVRDWVKKVVG